MPSLLTISDGPTPATRARKVSPGGSRRAVGQLTTSWRRCLLFLTDGSGPSVIRAASTQTWTPRICFAGISATAQPRPRLFDRSWSADEGAEAVCLDQEISELKRDQFGATYHRCVGHNQHRAVAQVSQSGATSTLKLPHQFIIQRRDLLLRATKRGWQGEIAAFACNARSVSGA